MQRFLPERGAGVEKESKKKLDIQILSLRRLKKVFFGSGVSSAEADAHKTKMEEVLLEKGVVYAYCDNKAVIAYFLFIRDTALLPPAEMEPKQALDLVKDKIIKQEEGKDCKKEDGEPAQDGSNVVEGEAAAGETASGEAATGGAKAEGKPEEKPQNVYCLKEYFILPEYEEEKEEMKKAILAELKERMQLEDYQGILWEDEVIQKKKVRFGAFSCSLGLLFGTAMGVLFGMIFDNIAIGICFGISFGISMGMAFME